MRDLLRLGKPLFVLWLLVFTMRPAAHEFWIEPLSYRLTAGESLLAHLKVGQHFNGDTQAYLPANIQHFRITLGGNSADVSSRIGDIPAVDETAAADGLVLLSLVSNLYTLEYKEPGLFEKFLAYEGLDGILAEHRRRGLPLSGFKEAYQRFAKSLVQVGEGDGDDRLLGLGFEWLLETNPHRAADNWMQARLYWRGEPLAATQARLFIRRNGRVEETLLTTDDEGRVRFSPEPGSELLLNAVQMREPSARFPAPAGSAWISYWTTLTFAMP